MQVFHRLVPANNARKITLWMLLPVVLTYVARILIEQSLNGERGPDGSLGCIILPIAGCLAFGWVVILLWFAGVSWTRTQNFAPILVLMGGTIFALIAPLPSLPQPVFPEETFFAVHRGDFEQVVTLARQNKLVCSPSGCEYVAHELPSVYIHLSIEGRVEVYEDDFSGLTVTFRPIDFYYPIIYFERIDTRNVLLHSICTPGSRYVRALDEHWYLCVEEWN
jgi:hypothetical protein